MSLEPISGGRQETDKEKRRREREERNAEQYRQGQGGAAATQSAQGSRGHVSPMFTILGLLDKPSQALKAYIGRVSREAHEGYDPLSTLRAASDAGEALIGKEHTTAGELVNSVLHGKKEDRKLPFGVSTAIDTATDPTSYLSFGASHAAKRGLEAAAEELGKDVAEDIAKRGAKAALSSEERNFLRTQIVRAARADGAKAPGETADNILKALDKSGKGGLKFAGRSVVGGDTAVGRFVKGGSPKSAVGDLLSGSETGRAMKSAFVRDAGVRGALGNDVADQFMEEVRRTADTIDARNAEVEAAGRNVGREAGGRRGLSEEQQRIVLKSLDVPSENEPLKALKADASEASGRAARSNKRFDKAEDAVARTQEKIDQAEMKRETTTRIKRQALEAERDGILKAKADHLIEVRRRGTMEMVATAGTEQGQEVAKRVAKDIKRATDDYHKAISQYAIKLQDHGEKSALKASEASAKATAKLREQMRLKAFDDSISQIETSSSIKAANKVAENGNTSTAIKALKGETEEVGAEGVVSRIGAVPGGGPAHANEALLDVGRTLDDAFGPVAEGSLQETLHSHGLPFDGWVDHAGRPTDQFWQMRQKLKNALHDGIAGLEDRAVNDLRVDPLSAIHHENWLDAISKLEKAKWLSATETAPAKAGSVVGPELPVDPALGRVVKFWDKQRSRITKEQIETGILKPAAAEKTSEYLPRYLTKHGREAVRQNAKDVSELLGVPEKNASDLEKALLQGGRLKKRMLRPDLNIHQINDLMVERGLLKKGEKFFEDNPLQSAVRRSIEANGAIEHARLLQRVANIKDANGEPILRAVTKDEAVKAADEVTVKMPNELNIPTRYVGHPEVVKVLNAAAAVTVNDASIRAFEKGNGYIMQIWRGEATLGPGYHSRNGAGNLWLNHLAHVRNPKWYREATRLQRAASKVYRTLGPDADFKAAVAGADLSAADKKLLTDAVDRQVIGHGFFDLDTPDVSIAGSKPSLHRRILPTGDNPVIKFNRKIGRTMENNARLAHYIAKVEELGSADAAARSVKKFLFDYSDLTAFERRVMKRLIPFYTFMRKNVPLEIEQAILNPRLFTIPGHAIKDAQDHGVDVMPDLPTGSIDDLWRIFNPDSTFQERGQALNESLNPFPKALNEWASGSSTFNGYPNRTTDAKVDALLRTLFPPLAKYEAGKSDLEKGGPSRFALHSILGMRMPPAAKKKPKATTSEARPSGLRPISGG